MYSELIKRLREISHIIPGYMAVTIVKSADALEVMQRELDAAKAEIGNVRYANIDCVDHFNAAMQDLAARDQVIKQYAAAIKYAQQATCLAADADPDSPIGKLYAEVSKCESIQPTTSALDAYVAEKVKVKDAEIDRLVLAIADHVTVRSEQHAEISKQAEALKLSRLALKAVKHAATEGYSYDFDCELFNTALAAINALEK